MIYPVQKQTQRRTIVFFLSLFAQLNSLALLKTGKGLVTFKSGRCRWHKRDL